MELYKKVYIKTINDLPNVEDEYYVHTTEDGLTVFNWYGANFSSNWMQQVDWYLQPIEITDEDIEAWANKKYKGHFQTVIDMVIEGAKAVINGEIKHIEK